MTNSQFNVLLDKILENTRLTLGVKAKEYAHGTDDRLHNFNVAAKVNNTTPIRAAHGMLTKHLIKYLDWIETGYTPSEAEAAETMGDIRNYTILEEGIWKEEREKSNKAINDRLPVGAKIDPKELFVKTPLLNEEGQFHKTETDKLVTQLVAHATREDKAVLEQAKSFAKDSVSALNKKLDDLDAKCLKLFQDLASKLTGLSNRVQVEANHVDTVKKELIERDRGLDHKIDEIEHRLVKEATEELDKTRKEIHEYLNPKIGALQPIPEWLIPPYEFVCKSEPIKRDGITIDTVSHLVPKVKKDETSNVSSSNCPTVDRSVHKG